MPAASLLCLALPGSFCCCCSCCRISAQGWLPGAGCHLTHWRWSSKMLAAAAAVCPPRLKACLGDPQAFFPGAPHGAGAGLTDILPQKEVPRKPYRARCWAGFPGILTSGRPSLGLERRNRTRLFTEQPLLGNLHVPRMVLGVQDTAVSKQNQGVALVECPFWRRG